MPETKSLVELEGRRFGVTKTAQDVWTWEVVDWAMSKVVATGLSETDAHAMADKLEASQ